MEIWSFRELNPSRYEEIYQYILSVREDPHFFSNREEMVRDFTSLTFHNGEHMFIAEERGRICGTLGVITKEAQERGELFLTAVNIRREDGRVFHILLNKAFEVTKEISGVTYKLGLLPEHGYLMAIAQAAGFHVAYRNLRMRLVDRAPLQGLTLPTDLTFHLLSKANAEDFCEVHNAAFRISPNGVILTPVEMEELVVKAEAAPNFEQVGYSGDKPVVIFSLSQQNGQGWIDGLGVHPAYHGKGYGKWGLQRCVETLQSFGCEEIYLTVVETNSTAYQLYRKYGFDLEKVNSIWLEK